MGLAPAVAGWIRTGGFPLWTFTTAVPAFPPAVAVRVCGPPAVRPAVNRPLVEIVPPPVTDQVNAGAGTMALPNWSIAEAVNWEVPPTFTPALGGETATEV